MAKENVKESATVGEGTVMDIPAKMVIADASFNVRKTVELRKEDRKKKEDSEKRDLDSDARELAQQIKKDGQLQPVRVELRKDGKYFLVFGFRRFRAICGPVEKGFLGRETIRAVVVEPSSELDRMYINTVENVARENLTAYDLSVRCAELNTKHGETGTKIANRLNKSVGYINNLIRIQTKCIKVVLKRWEREMDPAYTAGRICTVDWLAAVSKEDPEEQEKRFQDALGKSSGEGDGEEGEGRGRNENAGPRRATMAELKKALEAAKEKREASDDESGAVIDGVISALKFAMGATTIIPKVYKTRPKSEE